LYHIFHGDCFEWLRHCPPHSLQAVCTDPPYGILEFTEKELAKLRAGRGGVWRLPPKVGGSHRDPLPRFTVLTKNRNSICAITFATGQASAARPRSGRARVRGGTPDSTASRARRDDRAGFEVRPAIMRLLLQLSRRRPAQER